ncbi:MAG TPA: TRAP transporter substrate-binding protein DctP [Bacteroidota bacterium]
MYLIKQTVGLLLLAFLWSGADAQEHTIKFATLAPDGTSWVNVMRDFDTAVRKESGGKLGFKIYAGGVQGEDKDFIRKMRVGQIHSAGLTGVGLGEIAPKVRILDSPFLFESYNEVDHIYEAFDSEFRKAFEENGFVLLGWSEVGFVYVFTNTPIRSLADMSGVRMWMWEGDPIAEATFNALSISPIPLSVIDVLTSLQTGLINGAYISPYAALALQWNTRVKYMLAVPLADASGAVVMTKKKFDALTPDLQEILLRNGRKYMRQGVLRAREENTAAITTLKNEGILMTDLSSPKSLEEYVAAGAKARRSLIGKLYDQQFLDHIEKSIRDFRKSKSSTK